MRRAVNTLDVDDLHEQFFRSHDPKLRDALFEHYQGLALRVASGFAQHAVEREDVRQVAFMALVKALDRFDPGRGFRFSTFAWSTMQGEIRRYFRDHTWVVHVSRRDQELYLRVWGAIDECTQHLGRSPTLAEIAAEVGDPVERVAQALEMHGCARPGSLDAGVGDDDGSWERGEDDGGYARADARRVLAPLIAILPERERRIVYWRFVDGLTQAEIAGRLGISQMHVSRLLARSLSAVRSASNDAHLPIEPASDRSTAVYANA